MASTTKVHFNADTAERPKDQIFEPFTTVLRDRELTFGDPAEIDWQELANVKKPMDFFRYCLSQEDRDWLAEQKGIEVWRIGQLLNNFLEHYNATERVEERRALGL